MTEIEQLEAEIEQKKAQVRALRSRQKCPICGATFEKNTNGKYCSNQSPKDPTMTCKQYARNRLAWENRTPVKQAEHNVRSALAMRCVRHPDKPEYVSAYNRFLVQNKCVKEQVACGIFSVEDYIIWLEDQYVK